jgi:hypothetical protein
MSAPTGVNTTLVNIGNREDLEDKIYRVAPEETPFMSVIGRTDATAVTHEWQTETLTAASATSQLLEGDDVTTLDNPNLTSRIGNICQINGKKYGVSGTEQAVKSAGKSGSLSRQRILKGLEARRDAELRFTGNYATVAESGGTARKSGGALAGISVQRLAGGWRFCHRHFVLDLDRGDCRHHAHLHRGAGQGRAVFGLHQWCQAVDCLHGPDAEANLVGLYRHRFDPQGREG